MELKEFKALQLKEDQEKSLEKYRRLNPYAKKGQIVLTGSSLMEFCPLNELMQSLDINACVYNRGISGYVSSQLLAALKDLVLDLEPSKVFINIGTNDLGRGLADELWGNYEEILRRIRAALPDCRIYVMAYYPCNDLDDFGLTEEARRARFATRNPESLLAANARNAEMAERLGCRYIDVNEGLFDARGRMKKELCLDGVHLQADGYVPVLKNLAPYFAE